MKCKRIKRVPGDVYVAPFDEKVAKYSDERAGLWEPKENEECFIMQNVGMQKNGSILTVLYDGIYHYSSDLKDIDACKLAPLAIGEVIPISMTVGSFKKISNQLIPEDTPYMIYGYEHKEEHYITYKTESGNKEQIISSEVAKYIPRYGLSVTGGYMRWFADYFIKGIRFEYLENSDLERVKITKEAIISNFFSETKK